MAFPDISGYTAGEKEKVKADLDELSTRMGTRAAYLLAVDGLKTDEQEEIEKWKSIIDARAAELSA